MSGLESSVNNFDARAVIGPTQIGALLSAALFGCLACQSYVYFARFASDHLALKAAVSAVILIQLGHFICVISILWTMTVSTYGDPSQLNVLPLAADLAITVSGFTVFIVQSVYAFRLWRLTGNVFLPILCEMLSLLSLITTFIITAKAISMTDLTTFEDGQILLISLSWIARAASDFITTGGIAWSLKQKRGSDIREMMTMIDRLLYWTIETALVTGLMAITVAMLFLILKPSFVWVGAWLMWPNVVGNSLLVSLNRRLLLRETRGGSRGDAESRGGGLNMIMFRAGATQSQVDPPENFKNRDVQVFQEADHSINQEQMRGF